MVDEAHHIVLVAKYFALVEDQITLQTQQVCSVLGPTGKMSDPTDESGNLYLVRRYSEVIRGEMADEPLSQGLAVKVDSDLERERKGKYYLEEAMKGIFGEDGTDPKM